MTQKAIQTVCITVESWLTIFDGERQLIVAGTSTTAVRQTSRSAKEPDRAGFGHESTDCLAEFKSITFSTWLSVSVHLCVRVCDVCLSVYPRPIRFRQTKRYLTILLESLGPCVDDEFEVGSQGDSK